LAHSVGATSSVIWLAQRSAEGVDGSESLLQAGYLQSA